MPHDLINTPIIFALSEFTESDICKWFLSMLKIDIVAEGNLLFNEAMLAESGIGAVIGICLNYDYNNLCFVTPVSSS